jgi:hypothetical protein
VAFDGNWQLSLSATLAIGSFGYRQLQLEKPQIDPFTRPQYLYPVDIEKYCPVNLNYI